MRPILTNQSILVLNWQFHDWNMIVADKVPHEVLSVIIVEENEFCQKIQQRKKIINNNNKKKIQNSVHFSLKRIPLELATVNGALRKPFDSRYRMEQ